jgi:hypothetical protein
MYTYMKSGSVREDFGIYFMSYISEHKKKLFTEL